MLKQERKKENVAEGTGSTLNITETSSAEAVFIIPDNICAYTRTNINHLCHDCCRVKTDSTKCDLSPMRVKTGFQSPVTHTQPGCSVNYSITHIKTLQSLTES